MRPPNYFARVFWFAVIFGAAGLMVYDLRHRQAHDRAAHGSATESVQDVDESASAKPAATTNSPSAGVAETPAAAVENTLPAAMTAEPAPPRPGAPVPAAPAARLATIFDESLVLDLVAGKKSENLKRADAGLQQAIQFGKWAEYDEWLCKALAAELRKSWGFAQPNSYDRFLGNPLFYKALLQHTLIAKMPQNARRYCTEGGGRGLISSLITSTEAMESLLTSLRPQDDAKAVLQVWSTLAAEDPDALDKYRELALACALVFDKPFAPSWNGQRLEISAGQRYDYYKQHDLKGDLATRIHRMSAGDLVWVVCAPVPVSELEWALKKMHLRQKTWGSAYGMVPYDMEKAVTGKSKKPYDSYIFSEILEKGGICGDRAYFATNTARALGIPACNLGGDGPRGPHAWFGWMTNDEQWETTGRLPGYASGTTHDPQTGKSVSEQEFVRRSDPREASPATAMKAHRFLWMADLHQAFGETSKADAALEFALQASPRMPIVWEAKLAHWRKLHKDDSVAVWNGIVDELKRRFPEDKVMLAEARDIEKEIIFPRQDVKVSIHELKQDARRLGDKRTADAAKDAGFLAEIVRREAELIKSRNDMDGFHQVYRRAFQEHGADVAAFKAFAGDYFRFVKNDEEERLKACRQIEAAYERYVETKSLDYFDIAGQNSAHAFVARCCREAGELARAEKIDKENEKRLKKGKREAL